ncbi:hypothetical protein SAMN02910456_02436 [Ruminococcaceae bacterium YRB3002]|nr:hypothetical protein SAMN02910456_02436 [Ruminococcaceae bacterium YRB3002]
MTLLITVFAAVASTVVWYFKNNGKYSLGSLCLMYWGASIMWFVDAIFEYAELGAEFFTPASSDMLNDAFLGVSVVALGLVIWLVMLIVKDPDGRLVSLLKKQKAVG